MKRLYKLTKTLLLNTYCPSVRAGGGAPVVGGSPSLFLIPPRDTKDTKDRIRFFIVYKPVAQRHSKDLSR